MVPAAIHKAESLHRHVSYLGAPQKDFVLSLTLGEAYEMLDYIQSGQIGRVQNKALLDQDIKDAKEQSNPWLVLEHWQILGFDLMPAESRH